MIGNHILALCQIRMGYCRMILYYDLSETEEEEVCESYQAWLRIYLVLLGLREEEQS